MKTICLVRHAKSSRDMEELQDIDRPLKRRGIRDALETATVLTKRGVKPTLLLTSPAMRTLQTALIIARQLRMDMERLVIRNNIYEATAGQYKKIIATLPSSHTSVMIIGHEPGLSDYCSVFLGKTPPMPTSAAVVIRSQASDWKDFHKTKVQIIPLVPAGAEKGKETPQD